MSDPIRLAILLNLQAALATIAVAAGYHYTVKANSIHLDVVDLITASNTEMPLFIVASTPDGSRFYQPANRLKHIFQVTILAAHDAEGRDFQKKAWVREYLLADIEKALVVDITRGGLAYDTRLLEASDWAGMGNNTRVLVEQPVNVHLIRSYGSP